MRLFLLDTDLSENAPWDRELSARLYGGDRETRIQQEIILGIGGVRALRALGITPVVWHLNEGHAALVALQRIRERIEKGQSFESALDDVRRSTVFTTHTPVPAGHDAFPFHLVEKHLANSWGEMGQHRQRFLGLGEYRQRRRLAVQHDRAGAAHVGPRQRRERAARRRDAIDVALDLARHRRSTSVPVRSITNGVHVPTWMAAPLYALLNRHFGAGWLDRTDDPALWDRLLDIPDEDLWAMRLQLKADLFTAIRERMRARWTGERVSPTRIVSAGSMLDPAALTIGYARRFAAYKRPELIFHDAERLARILNATDRPVQIVFAGKAHPADEPAKHHLQSVFKRTLDPAFGGRLAFIDDYDMHVAHYLVHGCDVWLNNPRKPLEASGTSGMKASLNGVPHLSIGDGWWAEGFNGRNGWLIDEPGRSERPGRHRRRRRRVAVSPDRAGGRAGLLRSRRARHSAPWIQIVREAMRSTIPALLDPADGQAVRHGDVRAGRRRARRPLSVKRFLPKPYRAETLLRTLKDTLAENA